MRNRFEHYLEYLSGYCRPTTVKRVRWMIGDFIRWLENHTVNQWYEVTVHHIRQWLSEKSSSVKARTLFNYKQEVKSFLSWMYRNEYLLINPWDTALESKQPSYNTRYVPTVKQAEMVLDTVGTYGMHPARNRAVLELAYGCGLRRYEIWQLNVADIRDTWLRVRGKGDRERLVPLGKQAKKWILYYTATERNHYVQFKNTYEPALFLSRYGTRLGLDSYCYILRKDNLNRICTLHGLRHACATHMLANGANIRILQKLLGHRKLSSTQIYTKVDTTNLKELLQKYHPRG